MKKVFLFIAAAALTLAACEKKPVIPIDTDDPTDKPTPEVPEEGYKEKTWKVSFTWDELAGYAMDVAKFPGEEIADFFGLTQEEFYHGMGTFTGSTDEMTTSQENNTILFGVANKNNTEDLKWIPATSSSFGHWYTADGAITTWGGKEGNAVIYLESVAVNNEDYNLEWGVESPEAEYLTNQWYFNVGVYPGRAEIGKTYKATVVYFYTDEDDVELYAYVEYSVTIEAAKAVELDVVGTQEIKHTHAYLPGYAATSIEEEIDFDAIKTAIGIDAADATVYAINSDGSVYPGAGTNFWYSVAGDVMQHGAGCGIDINHDQGFWTYCNYPDETALTGATCVGTIAFVNPDTNKAYAVKVVVTLSAVDYLIINTLVSYETGETVYTLSEKNIAAIADALGVETLDLTAIGGDIAIKGVNADGSIYEGEYTANNGYWYSSKGDVTTYGSADFNTYIEYRGEGNFGCGLWGETGETNTVKLALVKGDKTAILTFNLEVDEQKAYETEEVGTLNLTATQKIAAGYGGEVIIVDYDALCTTLGLTDADFEEKFAVLTVEGTMDYTGESPAGFWFNVNNEICGWGEVNSAYYLNFKYGAALADASAGKLQIFTGIRNDNATDATTGEVTHTCPPAGTYTAVVRLANVETLKHVTLTVTLTVTAD